MTMGLKLQILPRTQGFLIYSAFKCIHNRTLGGSIWMTNQEIC